MNFFFRFLCLLWVLLLPGFIFAQPSNDLCENPIEITDLDGTCNSFSNVDATNTNPYLPTCFAQNPYHLVWFTFTAQGSNANITVSGVNRPEVAVIGLNDDGGTDLCDINDVLQYMCAGNLAGNYSSVTLNGNNSLTPGEEYLVLVNNNTGGGGGFGTFDLCIDNPENAVGQICDDAQAFCTDDPAIFDAGVDAGTAPPGNDYDCLTTQPNPAWFFMEVGEAGDFELTMASNPAEDIDFVMWGGFTSLEEGCDNLTSDNVVDCSFLAATTEVGNVTGAQAGEVYIILITNFSNNPTEVTFEKTGGDGVADCDIVLPVELETFTVRNTGQGRSLAWATASETNNDYFIVQRSMDGNHFEDIGKVQGMGTTVIRSDYSFQDETSLTGTIYYRLKQVDYNGDFETHKTVSVVVDNNYLTPTAYPNPARDQVVISVPSNFQTDQATIEIYSMLGRRIQAKQVSLAKGENLFEYDMSVLPHGNYIIKVQADKDAFDPVKLVIR